MVSSFTARCNTRPRHAVCRIPAQEVFAVCAIAIRFGIGLANIAAILIKTIAALIENTLRIDALPGAPADHFCRTILVSVAPAVFRRFGFTGIAILIKVRAARRYNAASIDTIPRFPARYRCAILIPALRKRIAVTKAIQKVVVVATSGCYTNAILTYRRSPPLF